MAGAYGLFGFGPPRQTLAGMPHFRSVTFQGPFPIATLSFRDEISLAGAAHCVQPLHSL